MRFSSRILTAALAAGILSSSLAYAGSSRAEVQTTAERSERHAVVAVDVRSAHSAHFTEVARHRRSRWWYLHHKKHHTSGLKIHIHL